MKNFISFIFNKRLWLFMGSGLVVSVAYIDPGNWGTNISGGSDFNYDLLWVIWMASGMAMLFQYLSGKIGIAGYSLPDLVRLRLKSKRKVFVFWLMAELAILATDLAEFLGIVVALKLLFGIPMIWGTFIAMIDVLILLLLTQKKFRYLESLFVLFVATIGFAFLYEVIISKPDFGAVLLHSVKPMLNSETVLVAVGIIGATVMPHALFVHSWLIKNKYIESGIKDKEMARKFHLFDNIFSLTIAGFINAAMLIMAAAAFYKLGGGVATLEDAYKTLVPLFGSFAAIVFAVALLSAGISSSITGALSGQAIMDGLMDFKIPVWIRRLITRFINLIPLTVAILLGIEPLKVLVYSQVVLSLMIPLPLIPIILFTSKRELMGDLVNKKWTTIFAWIFAAVILGFNFYLLGSLFLF